MYLEQSFPLTYIYIFQEAAVEYQNALHKCGNNYKLSYKAPVNVNTKSSEKSRKRNIMWFNPPYSKSVSTNVAKYVWN